MSGPSRQSAFTLLELLVVLVLVAFITTLLIQGMNYVARVNDSFLRAGEQRQLRELAFGWFVDSVSFLAAPLRNEVTMRFRGDVRSFEGLTLASVDRREGIPVPFAFRIEPVPDAAAGEVDFIYVRRRESRRWPLLRLQGDPRFQYQDAQGVWHPEWPPVPELADSLPEAVALYSSEGTLFLLATVQTPKYRITIDDR
ncbi:prepilin-type N-terminal cleavage/methylation domain-containing protein [Pseudomonas schmalbachii]|uniref:Prepilin-type N-terminal cleavage/methylation domain-containing protein n=1 Tax=Pseudomonas schmalbachii TaxID=2816993 RepID=A0ABS3TLQ2_9PSED|nr:prepilin-type N-terminal cleavage/methylation domain-containing protein [Pseudomonas schmalbachii]MBO3274596.1 prepilin-type N-terminal cleavage/methylation domain-containing protein [Pseudomonas schmalbachii]